MSQSKDSSAEVPYTLERIDKIRTRRLRTTNHTYHLTFNQQYLEDVPPGELGAELQRLFDNVVRDLREDVAGQDGDRVGISIEHPALDTPIRIPLQRMERLYGQDILKAVEKVQQSNKDLAIDSTMDVTLLHVEDPDREGAGRGTLRNVAGLETFLEHKQCIVQIKNQDDLCLGRAIVVAQHYALKTTPPTKAWLNERKALTRSDGKDHQGTRAKQLYHRLGLPAERCHGLDTLDQVGRGLAAMNYQLKVHSQDVMNRLLYKCTDAAPDAVPLHLYHYHDHYAVITSMPAFVGSKAYCEDCDQGYDHAEKHPCTKQYRCPYCRHPSYCGHQDGFGLTCLTCKGWFKNAACHQKHLQPDAKGISTCQSLHTCERCHQRVSVLTTPLSQHECAKDRPCGQCREPLIPGQHQCYMIPTGRRQHSESDDDDCDDDDDDVGDALMDKTKFIFYDFECMHADGGKHVPNLCVVHMGCGRCIGQPSDDLCEACPWIHDEGQGPSRIKVFRGPQTLDEMGAWLMSLAEPRPKTKKRKREENNDHQTKEQEEEDAIIVMAHNARAYDGHLLLQYFHKQVVKPPKVTLRGQQILQMTVGRLTFKDSLNFLTMRLADFPKTFGLAELKKGYFPHFFNTEANQTYRGSIPPVAAYDPDGMPPEGRRAFLEWHAQQVEAGHPFDFQEELLAYCQSDVDILRRGCAAFRHLFLEECRVDPLADCMTLPQACMATYKKNFLKPNTIAILPPHGYRPKRRYSQVSLRWFQSLMAATPGLHIQHARNGGEVELTCADGKTYSVDGFDAATGTVYEFMGCFWHGCPTCYKTERAQPDPTLGDSMAERFSRTRYRLSLLNQHPDVNKIVVQWECDFVARQKSDPAAHVAQDQDYLPEPLDPREAFYGGRTNATKLYYEAQEGETIQYVDVCSLYPYICKYGTFPVGHPTVRDHPPVDTLFELQGLVQCRILPPKDLYHPLLPYRAGGKLLFPLCRTCAETQCETSCPHTDEERAWIGTYTTLEVQEAVRQCGYRVLHIYEAWHFDRFETYDPHTQEGGLFAEYIDHFFKLKQEASGYPEDCPDREAYVEEIFQKEGIRLDPDNIKKNPGLRATAKFCLNSLWGKFGQRIGFGQTEYISSPQRYFALLRDERNTVNSIVVVNEDLVLVNYTPKKEFQSPHGAFNVAMAAWVTTQARLKLYSILKPLDRRVLYFDTDSVIYIHRPEEWNPPLGDTLGDLTDELSGNSIQTFVSGGPKNYAYELRHPKPDGTRQTTCKVRGFTLNYRAQQHLNYDSMKGLICGQLPDTTDKITVPYPNRIIRTGLQHGNDLLSRDTHKDYRRVYTKRRILYDTETGLPVDTLPFGYRD